MMQRRQFLRLAPTAFLPAAFAPNSMWGPRSTPTGSPVQPGNRTAWLPDGWGWRGQIALLMPHADVEPDSEFGVLAPEGVSVQAMRVRWAGVRGPTGAFTRYGIDAARAFVESPLMDEAVDMLVDAPLARPQAIALCFTSGSYALGPDGDLALKARLERRARGVPVALTCLAAVSALRAFGARRVAVIHPPWWLEDQDRLGAEYFRKQGFEVVYHGRAAVRNDRGNVHPGPLYEWARANVPREAEAVFMGGNGMRTIGAIQALEATLGKPVITSNQVAFWSALRLAKIAAPVAGYGQLFEKELPPQ